MPTKEWRENHKHKCLDCIVWVHQKSIRCWKCANVFSFRGKPFTRAHIENLSKSHLGQPSWSKGKKLSLETRLKISLAQKGRKQSEESKLKRSIALTGYKHSPEVGRKISQALKGKPRLNKRGVNAYQWKGGTTPIKKAIRHSLDYRLWREAVFKRDNWTCTWCKIKGYLNADHIKPFAYFPELRFALDNGKTLCVECHTWKTKLDNLIFKSSVPELNIV